MSRLRVAIKFSQLGQSMAEYTVVMAALIGGLLVANQGACPNQYEDCIEYLLTVMHDNYDGYSASLSAVHEYATDYEIVESDSGWGDSQDGDDGGDGSSGGESGGNDYDNPEDLVTDVSAATAIVADGGVIGISDPMTGEVFSEGVLVGYYDAESQTFTPEGGGGSQAIVTEDVVVDSEGNILEKKALVDGETGEVYAFGYESEANGRFYDSLQYKELDVLGYDVVETDPVLVDGQPDGGKIVNGYYYALTISNEISDQPLEPQGEVVYFEEYEACIVMAVGWDSAFDPDGDDYSDEVTDLWQNPPNGESPEIGQQAFDEGQAVTEDSCNANKIIAD